MPKQHTNIQLIIISNCYSFEAGKKDEKKGEKNDKSKKH